MSAGSHACDVLIEGRLDETGSVIYGTPEEVEELVVSDVWPTFFETSVFKQLQESYLWDESAQQRLIALFDKQFGETSIVLCWKLEQVLNDMLVTRDPFLNRIPQEPAAPEPPQLRKAREMKNLRAEVDADLERGGISVDAIKEKCRTNPDYARAYREVMYPKASVATLPEFSQELNDFAIAYNASTRASMNLVGGVRRVGGVPYGSDTFEKMLERASALGLIRG